MKIGTLAAVALIVVAVAMPAAAIQESFTAHLTGAAESPPNGSPGTGDALVVVDLDLHTMRVAVSFSDLVAGTTASHIHCCTALPGVSTATVATTTPTFPNFPLGVTSGTYDETFDMTLATSYNAAFLNNAVNQGSVATAFSTLVGGMENGTAYLNVHTTEFPGGEIRGFLAPVPEPGAMATMAVAVAAMASLALRRR